VLAATRRRQGDLLGATTEASISTIIDPECSAGYLEKAWILGAQRQFEQMLHMVDESIERNYGSTEAHICRAQALQTLHQPGYECESTVAECLGSDE
jgi:hypothetical protein